MKKSLIFTTIALSLFLSTTLSISAQIINGSFENGPEAGSFLEAYNGGGITGWTIDITNIDYIGSYWQAANGSRSVDLNGLHVASKISQFVPTVPGITYRVSFEMSGNPDGQPDVKTMTVTAADGSAQDYTYELTAENSKTNMLWEAKDYYFIAAAATTKLSFTSTTPDAFGPALDNVTITTNDKICHRNNSPGVKTLTVGAPAVAAHLAHGDTLGPCVVAQ